MKLSKLVEGNKGKERTKQNRESGARGRRRGGDGAATPASGRGQADASSRIGFRQSEENENGMKWIKKKKTVRGCG